MFILKKCEKVMTKCLYEIEEYEFAKSFRESDYANLSSKEEIVSWFQNYDKHDKKIKKALNEYGFDLIMLCPKEEFENNTTLQRWFFKEAFIRNKTKWSEKYVELYLFNAHRAIKDNQEVNMLLNFDLLEKVIEKNKEQYDIDFLQNKLLEVISPAYKTDALMKLNEEEKEFKLRSYLPDDLNDFLKPHDLDKVNGEFSESRYANRVLPFMNNVLIANKQIQNYNKLHKLEKQFNNYRVERSFDDLIESSDFKSISRKLIDNGHNYLFSIMNLAGKDLHFEVMKNHIQDSFSVHAIEKFKKNTYHSSELESVLFEKEKELNALIDKVNIRNFDSMINHLNKISMNLTVNNTKSLWDWSGYGVDIGKHIQEKIIYRFMDLSDKVTFNHEGVKGIPVHNVIESVFHLSLKNNGLHFAKPLFESSLSLMMKHKANLLNSELFNPDSKIYYQKLPLGNEQKMKIFDYLQSKDEPYYIGHYGLDKVDNFGNHLGKYIDENVGKRHINNLPNLLLKYDEMKTSYKMNGVDKKPSVYAIDFKGINNNMIDNYLKNENKELITKNMNELLSFYSQMNKDKDKEHLLNLVEKHEISLVHEQKAELNNKLEKIDIEIKDKKNDEDLKKFGKPDVKLKKYKA